VAVRRVTRGAVGNGQGRNMHTTITCIRLYPGMAISAASRISFVGLWRPGRWGLIVCIIFFLSRLARCIAYCEGFARFAGKASDAWAWVVVWLGMFCVFGKTAWDYVHWGLGVNGPNMVKHYFSAKFSAQRPSTVVRRFYLILESGCVSSVHTHQPCHFFLVGTVAQESASELTCMHIVSTVPHSIRARIQHDPKLSKSTKKEVDRCFSHSEA
jgi:hypothetical protein